jgi:uncharacterized C2H2 Zn-finger protein
MTDAKCPECGSYHETVRGYKDHCKDKHGYWPDRTDIMKAKSKAYEGPS